MIWTLRYKKPMGVSIVQIETVKDDIEDARKLGQRYVDEQASPGYRYISVERWLVATDRPKADEALNLSDLSGLDMGPAVTAANAEDKPKAKSARVGA